MSDDNVVAFTFPKHASAQIPGMTLNEVPALAGAALGRMTKPVMGCLMIFWDETGVMAVSDNRGQLYSNDQLNWITFGMAHLKGRGVVQPVATAGQVTPLAPPEGA